MPNKKQIIDSRIYLLISMFFKFDPSRDIMNIGYKNGFAKIKK